MSKVSVILPNYNHAKYLVLRIDSILDQTFQDYELIILDDCSNDNSREIIERYRNHPKVSHILFNETNSGSTFLQWEKGMQLATGKYIWIAESDDYSSKDFLKQLICGLENNSSAGIAFCASNITDENNFVSRTNYNYSNDVNELLSSDFLMNGKEFCEKYLFFGCVLVNTSAVVFEKRLYQKIGQDFKKYKVSGDWRMWVDICFETDVLYVNESLNYFRFHTNNVRTNKLAIMNEEAILNLLTSCGKTSAESVRKKLKGRLFKHWCFEFSRDLKQFNFKKSMTYMVQIVKIDHRFFLRLLSHLGAKMFRLQTK